MLPSQQKMEGWIQKPCNSTSPNCLGFSATTAAVQSCPCADLCSLSCQYPPLLAQSNRPPLHGLACPSTLCLLGLQHRCRVAPHCSQLGAEHRRDQALLDGNPIKPYMRQDGSILEVKSPSAGGAEPLIAAGTLRRSEGVPVQPFIGHAINLFNFMCFLYSQVLFGRSHGGQITAPHCCSTTAAVSARGELVMTLFQAAVML